MNEQQHQEALQLTGRLYDICNKINSSRARVDLDVNICDGKTTKATVYIASPGNSVFGQEETMSFFKSVEEALEFMRNLCDEYQEEPSFGFDFDYVENCMRHAKDNDELEFIQLKKTEFVFKHKETGYVYKVTRNLVAECLDKETLERLI